MKINNSILVLGVLSISFLIVLNIIQSSTAQYPRNSYNNYTIPITTIIDIVMSNIIMIRVMEIIMKTTIIDVFMSNIKRV